MSITRTTTVELIRRYLGKVGSTDWVSNDILEEALVPWVDTPSNWTFEKVAEGRWRYNNGGLPHYIYNISSSVGGTFTEESACTYKLHPKSQIWLLTGADTRSSIQVTASLCNLPEVMYELLVNYLATQRAQEITESHALGREYSSTEDVTAKLYEMAAIWRGVHGS